MRCKRCGDSPCIYEHGKINRCVVCACTVFTDGVKFYGNKEDEIVEEIEPNGYGCWEM